MSWGWRDAARCGPPGSTGCRAVGGLLEEWQLEDDGALLHGYVALVAPVRTPGGRPAVLKVGFPDEETEHEHLALRHWNGRGVVKLLRADPRRGALLLERLHPERLDDVSDLEACEIVAGLYRRLHVPAIPQLRTLTSYVDRWADDLSALPRTLRSRVGSSSRRSALARLRVRPLQHRDMIHGDLHYDNVMAGDREPWLAIDPQPINGDPHYELAPMLWNRFEELAGPPAA